MTSHYTRGSVTALHDFGGVGTAFGHFSFGLSQFHGHGSWLVCEVVLISGIAGLMTLWSSYLGQLATNQWE
jgi:hypothetical protein